MTIHLSIITRQFLR